VPQPSNYITISKASLLPDKNLISKTLRRKIKIKENGGVACQENRKD
jgi:hypothetical protein